MNFIFNSNYPSLPPNEGDQQLLELKPFEIYTSSKLTDSFRIINAVNQITTMDWCPTKLQNVNAQSQYLSFTSCPLKQINDLFGEQKLIEEVQFVENRVRDLFQCANLIYVCRFADLNHVATTDQATVELFGLLNKQIGHVNSLKWRPDCGASMCGAFEEANSSEFDSSFIGYLLSASSNGNGYIHLVQDMTKVSFTKASSIRVYEHGTVTTLDKLNVYETKSEIVLRVSIRRVYEFHTQIYAQNLLMCRKTYIYTQKHLDL